MPYQHAYDPASGELKGICAAFPAGAEHSTPTQEEAWQAAGWTVAPGPSMDAAGQPVGPQTHNYLGGALTAKRAVTLTPDKTQIIADGADQATVSMAVAGQDPPASLGLLVGDLTESVELVDGQGQLDPISAQTPCLLEVGLADTITYRTQPVQIEAVEDA